MAMAIYLQKSSVETLEKGHLMRFFKGTISSGFGSGFSGI
jgi:hypothetical protein